MYIIYYVCETQKIRKNCNSILKNSKFKKIARLFEIEIQLFKIRKNLAYL